MQGSQPQVSYTPQTPTYPQAQSNINQMLQGTAGNTQAYGGELTAPLNSLYQTAYNQASQYANSPNYTTSPLYQQAQTNMQNIMNPSYLTQQNPLTQYLQGYATNTLTPQAMAQTAAGMARTGPMSSSAAQNAMGQVGTNLGEYLQGLTAQQLAQNQSIQNSMIQPAAAMAQNTQQAPAQQAQNVMSLAQPFQAYAQSADTNAYNEWQRQMNAQTSLATSMQGQYPQYQYQVQQGQASPFSQYIAPALQGAGMIADLTGNPEIGIPLSAAGTIGNAMTQNYGTSAGTGQNALNLASLLGLSGTGNNSLSSYMSNALFGGGNAQNAINQATQSETDLTDMFSGMDEDLAAIGGY